MIQFKSCSRCSGDTILENDFYGWYRLCLCCGYVTYPDVESDTAEPILRLREAARRPA